MTMAFELGRKFHIYFFLMLLLYSLVLFNVNGDLLPAEEDFIRNDSGETGKDVNRSAQDQVRICDSIIDGFKFVITQIKYIKECYGKNLLLTAYEKENQLCKGINIESSFLACKATTKVSETFPVTPVTPDTQKNPTSIQGQKTGNLSNISIIALILSIVAILGVCWKRWWKSKKGNTSNISGSGILEQNRFRVYSDVDPSPRKPVSNTSFTGSRTLEQSGFRVYSDVDPSPGKPVSIANFTSLDTDESTDREDNEPPLFYDPDKGSRAVEQDSASVYIDIDTSLRRPMSTPSFPSLQSLDTNKSTDREENGPSSFYDPHKVSRGKPAGASNDPSVKQPSVACENPKHKTKLKVL